MSRRTYQQAQAWRTAAVALFAEVGIEVPPWQPMRAQKGQQVARDDGSSRLEVGKATLVVYLTGSVSIGGPGPDADYLCEPLERHGLLNGWHPGSRGSGVVWVPQPEQATTSLLSPGGVDRAVAEGLARFEERLRSAPTATGNDLVVRLRDWRDELAASGKPHEAGPWIARELERRFPEILTTDAGSGRVKP